MPQGFETYDASGNITISVTDRLTKLIGSFTTTTSNGSQSIGVPAGGTVWINLTAPTGEDFLALPRAYYSAGVIYWTFTDNPVSAPPVQYRRTATITYGVY